MRITSILLALLFLSACDDTFDPPSLLARPRVLGFVVSVQDEPVRTDPVRGETIDVRVPWAFPGQPLPRSFRGSLCVLLDTGFGIPECDPAFPSVEVASEAAVGEDLTFSLPVPADLPDGGQLLLFGGSCAGGGTAPIPASASELGERIGQVCERPEDTGELLQTTIVVVDEPNEANRQPAPLEQATLAGQPLLPTGDGLAGDPCAHRAELARLRVGDPAADLVVLSPPDAFDIVPETEDEQAATEVLQVALLLTSGESQANFLFVEANDLREDTELTPAEIAERDPGPEGSLERVVFAIRDRRGGLVVQDMSYCLLPASR
ncbi:MAG: hypothetical protein AAF645_11670 [Myxococcota bacterium]